MSEDNNKQHMNPQSKAYEASLGDGHAQGEQRAPETEEPNQAEVFSYASPFLDLMGQRDDVYKPTRLWLVTFTDIVALMITFFVLMYAMAVPDPEKFQDLTGVLTRDIGSAKVQEQLFAGDEDTITIERRDQRVGADLDYLQTLLQESLSANANLRDVQVIREPGQLILAWPMRQIFTPAGEQISLQGRDIMNALVPVLTPLGNQIALYVTRSETGSASVLEAFARGDALRSELKEQGLERDYRLRVFAADETTHRSQSIGVIIRRAEAQKQSF